MVWNRNVTGMVFLSFPVLLPASCQFMGHQDCWCAKDIHSREPQHYLLPKQARCPRPRRSHARAATSAIWETSLLRNKEQTWKAYILIRKISMAAAICSKWMKPWSGGGEGGLSKIESRPFILTKKVFMHGLINITKQWLSYAVQWTVFTNTGRAAQTTVRRAIVCTLLQSENVISSSFGTLYFSNFRMC